MDILEKLFGSTARVKIMRLFLFNANEIYDLKEIVKRSQVSVSNARRETRLLERIELIKKKQYLKEYEKKEKGKVVISKKKLSGWQVNSKFIHLNALQNLLIGSIPFNYTDLIQKISRGCRLKLLVVSGVFIREWDTSRVDLLVVGEKLKMPVLESFIRSLEAEIGKEIRYAIFDTSDFQYRVSVCDRLVRDILEYPHERLIDKIGVDIGVSNAV